MTDFHLSARARKDLLQIGRYTKSEWGIEQTAKYLDELQAGFILIAENPLVGRTFDLHRRKDAA